MGLLVSDVLERAREEIFEAGGITRPAWDTQVGALTNSATALTVTGRETYIPPDGVVEWEDASMEVADVYTAVGTSVTLQTRGYLGSTAAAHSAGVKVIMDPPYPRYVLFNALKAVISQLRGFGLYGKAITTALTYSVTSPVSLPSGAFDVVEVYWQNGSNWFPLVKGTNFRVFQNFGPLLTSPPAIQFLGGGTPGAALRVVYKTDFGTPAALTDDLDTLLVPSGLQHGLAQAVAGHVLMGRDVPHLESEHVQPDPQNPLPPGTRSSVGQMLWNNFIRTFVLTERVKQLEQTPPTITHGY